MSKLAFSLIFLLSILGLQACEQEDVFENEDVLEAIDEDPAPTLDEVNPPEEDEPVQGNLGESDNAGGQLFV